MSFCCYLYGPQMKAPGWEVRRIRAFPRIFSQVAVPDTCSYPHNQDMPFSLASTFPLKQRLLAFLLNTICCPPMTLQTGCQIKSHVWPPALLDLQVSHPISAKSHLMGYSRFTLTCSLWSHMTKWQPYWSSVKKDLIQVAPFPLPLLTQVRFSKNILEMEIYFISFLLKMYFRAPCSPSHSTKGPPLLHSHHQDLSDNPYQWVFLSSRGLRQGWHGADHT